MKRQEGGFPAPLKRYKMRRKFLPIHSPAWGVRRFPGRRRKFTKDLDKAIHTTSGLNHKVRGECLEEQATNGHGANERVKLGIHTVKSRIQPRPLVANYPSP